MTVEKHFAPELSAAKLGSGGDTLFADTVEAYKRLSPKFREFLETLSVVHTGKGQAQFSGIEGGIIRREPVESVHPLVREHPVLKEKILFVNQGFSKRIVGLKRGESDVLLDFLTRLVENTHDLQIRAHHTPGSVVIWDNRRTQHGITFDFDKPVLRHLARVTATGERPVVDLKYLNDINYKA
ncbi:TauD/TfdA dioxygenase family protein SCDLUD_005235 [Saccharomycodes ludwigii]|uniref:TauD/TfdA dioxygenase family protein n=1 Tax=Saccharomycodes ludwigii TaxID=36035 RepID=UPI001E8A0C95|nr:hypothetical protein SCDLUD_005235 [Saccharomycodes ludwigii]KAH3898894.1 hypothetical protein SCDLUD_005235 [Saccharomycodes ludwigii]